MSVLVKLEQAGPVSILTLNTPEQRNALSVEMREAATEALRRMSGDATCRAIVVTGAGGTFCAGGDLKMNAALAAESPLTRTPRLLGLLHALIREIATGPKPVVAAIDGHASGAGLSLATACDYIVAGPTAKFCASFGRVGLMPDAGLLWTLPQRIGVARSREMILSARVVTAEEALTLGLADTLAAPGETLTAAIAAAGRLSANAPLAAAGVRLAFAQGVGSLEAAFARELAEQPRLAASEDYEEGKAAFRQKRNPQFRGR